MCSFLLAEVCQDVWNFTIRNESEPDFCVGVVDKGERIRGEALNVGSRWGGAGVGRSESRPRGKLEGMPWKTMHCMAIVGDI